MSIGERLKSERERIGLNQSDFAGIASTTKKSQIDYEKCITFPNAKYLEQISKAGADIQFIVTGNRLATAPHKPDESHTIGDRLKLERERLEMTIPMLAKAAGVAKNTVIDWQNDLSSPPASRLAGLISVGVDVQYVISGIPSTSNLSDDELNILTCYRSLDACTKLRLKAFLSPVNE